MKNLFLLVISLFFISKLTAQNKISVTLKDGSSIHGLGRIIEDGKILLKKTKGATKEIYDYKTVEKLTIYNDDGVEQNYKHKIIEGSAGFGSVKLLEVVIVGEVTLYQDYSSGAAYGPNMMGGGYGFTNHPKTTYYIAKKGSDIVTNLKLANTYSKKFIKLTKKYFGDCNELISKIKAKDFKRYGIEDVVKYYNNNCN
ncbi:hypothetical protein FG167_06710 [Lacinutrix sp. WUR7]|uniref:hypothetical protein n=1 Tax=Lacinutrix sp. WUR7 TaxID=2653681 RepID=UPI00193E4642|nr:hypothetical protein [Lacinutrix sp. WUR7]QRM88937.1 hypothetical protein FG167_06710 [Lacinutrix sp. WUR7]